MEKPKPQDDLTDIQRLNQLIRIMYANITDTQQKEKYKMIDLLRAMEFKRKLAPPDDGEMSFWDLINGLRREQLPDSSESNNSVDGSDAK